MNYKTLPGWPTDWHIGGWRYERENYTQLHATSERNWQRRVRGLFSAPEEVDPRPWFRVENQRQQGACQGFSLSNQGEYAYMQAVGEQIQFAPQFCYIRTQIKDGIQGDRGSTIEGGEWVAKNIGFATELVWGPYTGLYSARPTSGRTMEECLQEAAGRKIVTSADIESQGDGFVWMSSGLGSIHIGITWNKSCTPINGVIETYDYVTQGGGHSVSFLGYSKRKDKKGRNYWWMLNSWGTSWGNKGWAEVSPTAVEQMLRGRWTVMRGMTDLQGDAMRPRRLWVERPYKRPGRYATQAV